MKQALIALGCGFLFGLGLMISGMSNPAKVLGFLNILGDWDPSLALVMGGGLMVTLFGWRRVAAMPRPFASDGFNVPTAHKIDRRLVIGAILFGVGWGLVGLCPGPAITLLALSPQPALIFTAALAMGFLLADRLFPSQR